jgi:hypothetical protein
LPSHLGAALVDLVEHCPEHSSLRLTVVRHGLERLPAVVLYLGD